MEECEFILIHIASFLKSSKLQDDCWTMSWRQLHLKHSQLLHFIVALWGNSIDQIIGLVAFWIAVWKTWYKINNIKYKSLPFLPITKWFVLATSGSYLPVDSISVLIFFPSFSICSIPHFVNTNLNEGRHPKLKASTVSLNWSFSL